ncbi:lytic transglycosylase domain-containing protein [Paraburkholderia sartisoli]|uniref:Transglycosylase SLT domain-containing protein n=1 Tax=Paraburkholderia sartisoli TaxID=83784 RepID=A0A1H3XW90_9BURK|nr:lytic transglycosylase domain-containing protein [Paraburkholderia sartisoli]SEA03583.1 Transglycosylase SLT domain-containing protein [Paraburkholderia sartisoli]
MRHAYHLVAPLGIGICIGTGLTVMSAPARAAGVSYVIGGHTLPAHDSRVRVPGATPGRSAMRGAQAVQNIVGADADTGTGSDVRGARGVVLAGATLALSSRTSLPRASASACAGCNYATMAPLIRTVSRAADVDPALVAAVIDVESGFNRRAVSPAGAQGLMQLMPATALRFGVSNVYDPVQNVAAGALYLGQMLRQFSGNLSYALAAYNAGEANVRTYGGIPPFAETQAYVPRVLSRYAAFRAHGAPGRNVAGPQPDAIQMTLTEYR